MVDDAVSPMTLIACTLGECHRADGAPLAGASPAAQGRQRFECSDCAQWADSKEVWQIVRAAHGGVRCPHARVGDVNNMARKWVSHPQRRHGLPIRRGRTPRSEFDR